MTRTSSSKSGLSATSIILLILISSSESYTDCLQALGIVSLASTSTFFYNLALVLCSLLYLVGLATLALEATPTIMWSSSSLTPIEQAFTCSVSSSSISRLVAISTIE